MALQFQVPQFVDVEDKIFGPLTAKQFLMFVMAFLTMGGMWYSPLPKQVTIILSVPIIIFTLLLAFYKVNGRTFVWYLYAIVHFVFTGKKFLWDRRGETPRIRVGSSQVTEQMSLKRTGVARTPITESRIQGLARILDTAGKVVDEDAPAPEGFERT
jgi:PrgI family protein